VSSRFSLDQVADFLSGELDRQEPDIAKQMREDLKEPDSEISRFFAGMRAHVQQILNLDWERLSSDEEGSGDDGGDGP
jgi:hypothetical protein